MSRHLESPTKWALPTTALLFFYALAQIYEINGATLNSIVPNYRKRSSPFINNIQINPLLKEDPNITKYDHVDLNLQSQNPSTTTTMKVLNQQNSKATNLTALTWAHAVNSQRELNEALNSNIDMIEADIVLGKVNSSGPEIPVMAHPPANSSDISLADFLDQINLYNNDHLDKMKGVKLDFKSIEVFEGSLTILHDIVPIVSYPVWLNADIVSGPVNQTETVPVDPKRFFTGCSPFNKVVLSIGWTTKWGANFTEGAYTPDEIDDMLNAIKNNNVTSTGQTITFPVRAGIAANSREQLHELMNAVNDTNDSSLTIWSSQNDYVNIEKLRELIYSFGYDRVYLDVPEEVASQLNLGKENNGGGALSSLPSLINFTLISTCLLLVSLWLHRSHI